VCYRWRLSGEKLFISCEHSYGDKRYMGKFLCGIGRIVLIGFVIVSVLASNGIAESSLSRFNSENLQAFLFSIKGEERVQSRTHEPVRASGAMSDDEVQLYRMLMDYRRNSGQPSIPVSPSLSRVARMHVRDLEAHPPSGSCNLHSWSAYGPWKSVCYSGSECATYMFSKPRELTGYDGNGYEIVAWSSGRMLPDHALDLWEGSSTHNSVIVNSGCWERLRWKAVGLAISGSYAVVWFGEESDTGKR
jgi:hypothetical protein